MSSARSTRGLTLYLGQRVSWASGLSGLVDGPTGLSRVVGDGPVISYWFKSVPAPPERCREATQRSEHGEAAIQPWRDPEGGGQGRPQRHPHNHAGGGELTGALDDSAVAVDEARDAVRGGDGD